MLILSSNSFDQQCQKYKVSNELSEMDVLEKKGVYENSSYINLYHRNLALNTTFMSDILLIYFI